MIFKVPEFENRHPIQNLSSFSDGSISQLAWIVNGTWRI